MKITHISPLYYPALGGAEHHLKEISEGLAKRGHDVTVLAANVKSLKDVWLDESELLPQTEFINGVRVVRLQKHAEQLGRFLQRWSRLRGGYRSLAMLFGTDGTEFLFEKPAILQIIPYLLKTNADIVMSMNWYFPSAYYTYLARRIKSFTWVGTPLFHTAELWSSRTIYRRMLSVCDAALVNTVHEAEFVRSLARTPTEVAGVGVWPELFEGRDGNKVRQQYKLGNAPVVGFVGRQDVNKGLIQLIDAMRTVWKWNPNVRLVLAGHRPLVRSGVDIMLESLNEAERKRIVRINEFSEKDKPSLYDAFDVFVLPSEGESFGIAYLEAWLCHKPVIGARIGSTQCVIGDGIDGLLVDHKDAQDIAAKIIDLLTDPVRCDTMGRKGNAKTLTNYTWEKVIDKVENLYLRLSARDMKGRLLSRLMVRDRCAQKPITESSAT
jgi:glycosyltransferase involved in cell wall biosynthesis